jgi:hypothetical protein
MINDFNRWMGGDEASARHEIIQTFKCANIPDRVNLIKNLERMATEPTRDGAKAGRLAMDLSDLNRRMTKIGR